MGDELGYKISYDPNPRSYEDGFAEGYSRAWQECWNIVVKAANAHVEKGETVASPNKTEDNVEPSL